MTIGPNKERLYFGQQKRGFALRAESMAAVGGYCCKSRKSNNPKNLAKVDLWASLRLLRSLAPLRRFVIDFGSNDMVPHVAARKTHQGL
jgi:hypothetical protein